MEKHGKLAEVKTVDNFQGEECDIILLSLVRSNEDGKIGFLKERNRVNVALSRAKRGLYCVGNFDCLAQKSELWQKLTADLKAENAIGPALELTCQNHTDQKTMVFTEREFDAVAEGGCSQPCLGRLLCGHVCAKICHIEDRNHHGTYDKCIQQCDQFNESCEQAVKHKCSRTCHRAQSGRDCGDCMVKVEKIRPGCEHIVNVACSCDPAVVFCDSQCRKTRSCGHACKNKCSEDCETRRCDETVSTESPCGHSVQVRCED